MCYLMKRRMRQTYYGYGRGSLTVGKGSMRVMDNDENECNSEDSPVLDSEVLTKYGATHTRKDETEFLTKTL